MAPQPQQTSNHRHQPYPSIPGRPSPKSTAIEDLGVSADFNSGTLSVDDFLNLPDDTNGSPEIPVSSILPWWPAPVAPPETPPESKTPAETNEINYLSDDLLIPAVAIFFEKLHPILPIFTRSWLLDRIAQKDHLKHNGFAGMLLALSALTKVQPGAWRDDASRLEDWKMARLLLERSVKVRASATMGSRHTLDDVLASFYTFCTLTGLQEQDAFTFRLRESLHLGLLLKIHVPDSYISLDLGEQERRLRTYWILCVTERALALWTAEPLLFRGAPMSAMSQIVANLAEGKLRDYPQKLLKLLECVDETFLQCWHRQCFFQPCILFDQSRALHLHASLSAVVPWQSDNPALTEPATVASRRRDMVHAVDVALTQQWLQCHVWQISLTHGLISANAPEELFSPIFPLHCGQRARHYYQTANTASRDAHGIGLIQKLYDVGTTLLQAYRVAGTSDGIRAELEKCAWGIVSDCRAASSAAQDFGDKLEAAVMDCRRQDAGS